MGLKDMRQWLIRSYKGARSDEREHREIVLKTDDATIARLIDRNYPGGLTGWALDH